MIFGHYSFRSLTREAGSSSRRGVADGGRGSRGTPTLKLNFTSASLFVVCSRFSTLITPHSLSLQLEPPTGPEVEVQSPVHISPEDTTATTNHWSGTRAVWPCPLRAWWTRWTEWETERGPRARREGWARAAAAQPAPGAWIAPPVVWRTTIHAPRD